MAVSARRAAGVGVRRITGEARFTATLSPAQERKSVVVNPWVDHPNPWAGQRRCPTCESSLWALPFDPSNPDTRWRCVACSAWLPETKERAA